MANRVNLDAMIPREDFAIEEKDQHTAEDRITEFQLLYLAHDSHILKLLRKPEFQRETNHWSASQIKNLIASFLDNEVIPSLIFWDSASYIFVLDGGHRLSALRAWIEDDYGDKKISSDFYEGQEISQQQKDVAAKTRKLIEKEIGRYSDLKKLVDSQGTDLASRRAKRLFKRRLLLQWVHGNPEVAESSFYKINSLGAPLDDTERMLIENRKKPIAIAARVTYRGGSGHKYWSSFTSEEAQKQSVALGKKLYDLLFEPESEEPHKTIDVPIGGSVSPVDALAILVDFFTIAANRQPIAKTINGYDDDITGEATVNVLARSIEVAERITGSSKGSLGLHTAIYFYNDKGKHSKFLFLGMVALVAEKLRNNDSLFFKKFTKTRSAIEDFLIENKSVIGFLLQNLGKTNRVPKLKDMYDFLVSEKMAGQDLSIEKLITHLGMTGRIVDVRTMQTSSKVTDETQNAMMMNTAIRMAPKCPLCGGRLEPNKSKSPDHITDVKHKGTGDITNLQFTYPYCNHSKDSLL